MILFFQSILYLFSLGYSYGMIVLIIAYFINKNKRPFIVSFMSIGNAWFIVYAIISCFTIFNQVFLAWYSQNPYQGYTFKYSRGASLSNLLSAFLIQNMLIFLIAVSFCFKRTRANVFLSIIAVAILHFAASLLYIIVSLSLYKDNLPSPPISYFHQLIAAVKSITFFGFLISVIYLYQNNRYSN